MTTPKPVASPLPGNTTETALIQMLDRHGERQAAATTKGMEAIAVELRDLRTDLRDVREDNNRTMNRMLILVGIVALVAMVMMAGLVRATYLSAGLDGVKAGSGSAHADAVGADVSSFDIDTRAVSPEP